MTIDQDDEPTAPVVTGAPERIWLQTGVDTDCDFADLTEVSWCMDHIDETDIAYVRADLFDQQAEQIACLTAERDRLRAALLETVDCDFLFVKLLVSKVRANGREWKVYRERRRASQETAARLALAPNVTEGGRLKAELDACDRDDAA